MLKQVQHDEVLDGSSSKPRLLRCYLRLMCRNRVNTLQRQADFVDPVHQAMLAKRVDRELEPVLKRRRHRLRFEVDMDRVGLCDLHQPVDCCLRQLNRQQTVFECVA